MDTLLPAIAFVLGVVLVLGGVQHAGEANDNRAALVGIMTALIGAGLLALAIFVSR